MGIQGCELEGMVLFPIIHQLHGKTDNHSTRVFLLGPSHQVYLDTCALSAQLKYETPCGDLKLDASILKDLQCTGAFAEMSKKTDEDEHSLEMQLPYIYKMLQLYTHSTPFSHHR
jgi:AmmeMemoRadiSam system protein B